MRILVSVGLQDESPERVKAVEEWLRNAIRKDMNSDALNGLRYLSCRVLDESESICPNL